MKILPGRIAAMAGVAGWLLASLATNLLTRAAGPAEGVALAIVYDTSGSMQQKVPDANGRATPKHVIAKRALTAVLDRLHAVVTAPGAPPLQVALITFRNGTATTTIKLSPFDRQQFRNWLHQPIQFHSGTPLGEAVRVAGQAVLGSALPRKHVLVITDGMNTQGPDPSETMPALQQRAKASGVSLSVHFVAFDVNANVFADVKKLGATVVGAADEAQLNSQLEFILEKKILLEEEEVPPAKPKTN